MSLVTLGCQTLLTLSYSLNQMLWNRPRLQPSLRPSLERLVCMKFRMSSVLAKSHQGKVEYLTTVAMVYADDTYLNMGGSLYCLQCSFYKNYFTREARRLSVAYDHRIKCRYRNIHILCLIGRDHLDPTSSLNRIPWLNNVTWNNFGWIFTPWKILWHNMNCC